MPHANISSSLIEINPDTIVNNRILVVDDEPLVIQTYRESLDPTTFDLSDFDFLNTAAHQEVDPPLEFEVSSAVQCRARRQWSW